MLVGCSSSVVAGGSASPTAPKPAAGDMVVVEGPRAESAVVDGSGLTVKLAFIGSPQPIERPCGEDYQATAQESASSVVVTIERLSSSEMTTWDVAPQVRPERRNSDFVKR